VGREREEERLLLRLGGHPRREGGKWEACFPGCLVDFAGEVEFGEGVFNGFGGKP